MVYVKVPVQYIKIFSVHVFSFRNLTENICTPLLKYFTLVYIFMAAFIFDINS
jgi:hypothetical protein